MMTLRERNKMLKDALDYENPNVELSTDRKKKTMMERGGK